MGQSKSVQWVNLTSAATDRIIATFNAKQAVEDLSAVVSYDEIASKNYSLSAGQYMAEVQAMRHIPMTMSDWEGRLGGFLKLRDREILQDAGKVSAELAKVHAESEFEKYRIVQDRLFESDFDKLVSQLAPEKNPGGNEE